MKLTKKHMSKGFTLVELLVVIAIIAALAAMATPVIMKQQKKAAMTEATSNAKQVFYLLVDFDQEYGHFPDAANSAEVEGASGSTSNDVLKQLFLGGFSKSEEVFYAKSSITKKPDGDVGTAPEYNSALEGGECGFLYVDEQSTSGNTARPLLMAPLVNTTSADFDSDAYGGKAVGLRIDGAVKQYRIDETSKEAVIKIDKQSVNVLGTGNPVWDDVPTLLYPKQKGS